MSFSLAHRQVVEGEFIEAMNMHCLRDFRTYLMNTWTENGNEKSVVNILQEMMTDDGMSDLRKTRMKIEELRMG